MKQLFSPFKVKFQSATFTNSTRYRTDVKINHKPKLKTFSVAINYRVSITF